MGRKKEGWMEEGRKKRRQVHPSSAISSCSEEGGALLGWGAQSMLQVGVRIGQRNEGLGFGSDLPDCGWGEVP